MQTLAEMSNQDQAHGEPVLSGATAVPVGSAALTLLIVYVPLLPLLGCEAVTCLLPYRRLTTMSLPVVEAPTQGHQRPVHTN